MTAPIDMQRRTVSVPELASALGISERTAYDWLKKGIVRSVKIGGRLLIPREAIDELLAPSSPQPAGHPAAVKGARTPR